MKHADYQYIDILYSTTNPGVLEVASPDGNIVFSADILPGNSNFLALRIPQNISFETCTINNTGNLKILDMKVRKDFFDFFNFKQKYNTETICSDLQYQECTNKIRSGITFFVTYKCTYKCPFCWQRVETTSYAAQKNIDFDPAKLVHTFNRLLPAFIYFTGGEPTLYKHLFPMISMLDPQIKCRITSNLGPSFDVDKFTSLIDPDRFEMLMFSYHPSETTKKQFLTKIDKLIANGFTKILVESVLYSSDIPKILEIKDDLEVRNIIRRYDSCCLPNGKEHILSAEAQEMTRILQDIGIQEQADNNMALQQSGNMFANKQSLILCPAGHKNFHIDPAGDVYPCMSALDRSKLFGKWALPHYQPIGNIQDPNFDYLSEPIICWEAFRCSACDYEALQSGWRYLDEAHPPLPE